MIVSSSTTIIFAIILFHIERSVRRLESSLWANRKIIERKLQVYDETMPLLNDLLCFYTRVGDWQNLSPPKIREIKRKLDKTIYIAKPLFSQKFFQQYSDFMELCYLTYQGPGEHAKLRANFEKYRDADSWKPEYCDYFIADWVSINEIRTAYEELGQIFVEELELMRNKK
jgi:hypothetical protein